MADPLSVIASGVGVAAFAQQLGQSIFTLRRLCEDIKNAPSDLKETLDQIEHISRIMERLTHDKGPASTVDSNNDILNGSLQLCQKAVDRVSKLASDLQKEIEGKKLRGSIKTALKRDSMERLLTKLDRSKTDLNIAYSKYERSYFKPTGATAKMCRRHAQRSGSDAAVRCQCTSGLKRRKRSKPA